MTGTEKRTQALTVPGKVHLAAPAALEFAITCHVTPKPAPPGTFGSAVLIDPHFALTAAHNLFFEALFDSVVVAPGHLGESNPLWPKVVSTQFVCHERFLAGDISFDIGLIYFPKPFKHAFKFAEPIDAGAQVGDEVRVLGYRNKPTLGLYEQSTTCKGHEPGRVFYDADTITGQSGGPLFIGSSLNLIGIHTYGLDKTPARLKPARSATLLRKDLIQWINRQKDLLRGVK